MTLPVRPEALRGLRAARWVRESTAGQADRYGPDAQREQQDRALERYGLVDTGVSWSVAHSGRTIASTTQFGEMLASAGREYDVLLVGYVSRFARNLRTAVNARHDLHAAGAAVLFCDERVLSSDEDAWETWAREAVEAEAYSRRLGRRIREGYEAKFRRHADPGGHAPYGFRRDPVTKLMQRDPAVQPVVARIVGLAASGWTDRAIADEVDLGLYVVRGLLTSPLIAGRLRDGSQADWGPLVDLATWNRAQTVRATRATNTGRPASPRRPYALSMLRCAACGDRLSGDTGYYRHHNVCPEFAAATPDWPSDWHGRRDGKGYARHLFEGVIEQVLEQVSLRADTLTRAVGMVAAPPVGADRLALARIERERDSALARYRRDRDLAVLDRAMARLDLEEAEARRTREADGVPADVAVRYLRDLATTWRVTDGGSGRRMLAEALFERIDARGFREATLSLSDTAIAHGFAAVVPERLDLTVGYGRGERI